MTTTSTSPAPSAPRTPARAAARDLLRQSGAGLRLLLVLTVVLGLAYPAVVLAVGQLVPGRADGSMTTVDGRPAGSSLIGQAFPGDQWFQPRPSAAGKDGYDPQSSGASNLGPDDAGLLAAVTQRREEVAAREGTTVDRVPADAVTASGSGLDPDISPAYAALQVARVARVRGLAPQEVDRLVAAHTSGRDLGFVGEPVVDVVTLNAALAALPGQAGR